MNVFYKGFAGGSGAINFVEQYRLAWLYAPDDVVRAIETFLATQKPDKTPEEKDKLGAAALAELVFAVRSDLFNTARLQTGLTSADFMHVT